MLKKQNKQKKNENKQSICTYAILAEAPRRGISNKLEYLYDRYVTFEMPLEIISLLHENL